MTTKSGPKSVLILEPDRLRCATMFGALRAAFPGAIVNTATDPKCAAAQLSEFTVELFIVALRGFDVDVLTLLTVLGEHKPRTTNVLIVANEVGPSSLRALLHVPVGGVFNCFEGDIRELEFACRVVAGGGSYWSRSVRESMKSFFGEDSALVGLRLERGEERIKSPPLSQSRFEWSDAHN